MKSLKRSLMIFSIVLGFCLQASAALTPPKPTASDGTYTSYVYVSWSKVSGAKSYEVRRGTSTTFSYASRIAKTSNTYYYDYSAVSGINYYYWILPVDSKNCGWYTASRYDKGYRQQFELLSWGSCPTSLTVGDSIAISVKYGSRYVMPSKITITSNLSGSKYSTLLGNYCGSIKGLRAGTATVSCTYAGQTIKRTMTIIGKSTPSPSPSPTPSSTYGYINGSSSVTQTKTVYYTLYVGGVNVTSKATWKSGLYMTAYKGGRYYVGNPPKSGTSTTIKAVYNGKTYSKTVKVYKK